MVMHVNGDQIFFFDSYLYILDQYNTCLYNVQKDMWIAIFGSKRPATCEMFILLFACVTDYSFDYCPWVAWSWPDVGLLMLACIPFKIPFVVSRSFGSRDVICPDRVFMIW
jgi:hypothetical protein